jgi:putative hydrolase of the HAD superfamily
MLALLDGLRKAGLRLGLLSNSAPEHEAVARSLEGRVDVAHFSHRTGRRKPDRAAYDAAVAALGLPPEAVWFVDDKARNVVAAQAAGLRGAVFTGVSALVAELAALGLIVPASAPGAAR